MTIHTVVWSTPLQFVTDVTNDEREIGEHSDSAQACSPKSDRGMTRLFSPANSPYLSISNAYMLVRRSLERVVLVEPWLEHSTLVVTGYKGGGQISVRHVDIGGAEGYEGGSLDQKIRHGPFYEDKFCHYFHTLYSTLRQMHGCGLVVWDIKPPNILLDPFDLPVLADFGITEVVNTSTQRLHTSIRSTFNYMV